jgi:hypothetical protein
VSEVDTISKQTFDKNLANIAPCGDRESAFEPTDNVIHSVKLHPTQGFIWEREEIDAASSEDGVIPPTGWNIYDDYYDRVHCMGQDYGLHGREQTKYGFRS